MKAVTNGSVWISGSLQPAQILIGDSGRVEALLEQDQPLPEYLAEVIDANGLLVLPGGIDMHAHLEDGAETFYPGTCAAAVGGITTVVDMPPFHTCTSRKGCEARLSLAQRECAVDFGLGGGIVVDAGDLTQLGGVAAFGAPYFKVFMPSEPPVDTALLWKAVQAAASYGLRLALHAEETSCLSPDVNWNDPLGFARARPVVAETSATAQVLEMALAAGAPVHICHVSAGRTAELIDAYRGWGMDVTAETTPHFLIFDETAFFTQGVHVKTTPPLRTSMDRDLLWQALAAGVIDAVVSDHYLGTLPDSTRRSLDMQATDAGIAGLEVSLPVLYDAGVKTQRISLMRFIEVTSQRPAEIAGYASKKGRIQVGWDADLVIFDPQVEWSIQPHMPHSRLVDSPYVSRDIKGQVLKTLVRGMTIWDGENICAPRGAGHYIEARYSERN